MRKSKEKKEYNLSEILGDGVNIKESKKSILKKDRQFFVSLVETLLEIDARTEHLIELGLDLINYEDPYHNIIEGLIFKHYGNIGGEVIIWWLGEKRLPEDKNIVLQGRDGIDHPVNTPIQLYNILQKIDKLMQNAKS